jgi:transglutaminase-like putative cysteine protease
MFLRVLHQTVYSYPGDARDSHNELRLAPLNDLTQSCLQHEIIVDPSAMVDCYMGPGGLVHTFNVRPPHRRLSITLSATVETHLDNPFALLDAVLKAHGESPVAFILGVKEKLAAILDYDTDVTHVHTDSDEVLALRQGVCQDFAHVMLAILRCAGIPCRYVSGYIYNGENDHLRGDQAMHAWVDCLLPGGTWLGIDPTNDILANDHHIKVHVGADYSEVTPTKGIYWGMPSAPPEVKVSLRQAPAPVRSGWGQSQTSWTSRPGFQTG